MVVEYVSSDNEFWNIIGNSGNKLIVVDFYAEWCGPCHAIAPTFEKLSNKYARVARFLKVDVDGSHDIAKTCQVSAMPTFQFFKKGDSRARATLQGADPAGLENLINTHAPSSAEISFSGAGHQLGSSSSGTSAGPPKVNWDSPAAQDEIKRRREAMAAAAAQRVSTPAAPAPTPEEPKNEDSCTAAGPSSASASAGTGEASEALDGGAADNDGASSSDASKGNDVRLKVDENLLKTMLEMGFPQVRAEKALILTGNKSLEPAMEWIFEHQSDADIDEPLELVTEDGVAKPVLSEEERKKRANEALLRARKKREEEDRKASHDRERNRIRSGKEITEARRQHEENERKRAIEAKRKEKREAAAEKKRVQELVAADRAARREKFGKKPSESPGAPTTAPAPVRAQALAAQPTGGKLQLRFSDGTKAEHHFEPEHTLNDVIEAVVSEKPTVSKSSIRLATMYPRRTFDAEDYTMTLVDLKLLPRGVLNVTI